MATSRFDFGRFDSKTIQTLQAEAQRSLHATVGAADLALEAVRDAVTDAQKRLAEVQRSMQSIDLQPSVLREQATSVVTELVDELSEDARTRREAVEKRVAELQTEATDTYDDLVKRGQTLVRRFRNQPAARETVANARTAVAKAKTTRTQATKTARKATAQAKRGTTQARKTAQRSAATSSAKATGTAAKKAVKSAAKTVS